MYFRRISCLVKPTLHCNARCIYCHSLRSSPTISLRVLEEFLTNLAMFSESHGILRVRINWHGGEPMLMGAQFYQEVMDFEKKIPSRIEFRHSMQSNACLYKGEMRLVLRDFLTSGFIGTSFDPFHPTRLLSNGEDSAAQSIAGTRAMLEDGLRVSLIYVVHKRSVEVVSDLYYFFKDLGIHYILFHPLQDFDDPEYSLSPREWGEFLMRLWDVWKADGYSMNIDPLLEWRSFLVASEPVRSCEHGQCPKRNLHLTLSPEGYLYPCHRFQDKDTYRIGHVGDLSFDEIIRHPWTHLLSQQKRNLSTVCKKCDFVEMCHSGCVATHDEEGKTVWCEGYRAFLTYMKKHLGI